MGKWLDFHPIWLRSPKSTGELRQLKALKAEEGYAVRSRDHSRLQIIMHEANAWNDKTISKSYRWRKNEYAKKIKSRAIRKAR